MKNISKRTIIIITALLALGLLLVTLEKTDTTNFIKVHSEQIQDGPTAEELKKESQADSDAKKAFIEDDKTSDTDDTPPSQSSSIELSAKKESESSVTVFTKLRGISSGDCKLTVDNAGRQNAQTASVIYQSEFSICSGFSVPIGQLGTGTWNIKLSVNSGGHNYSNAITYEVK